MSLGRGSAGAPHAVRELWHVSQTSPRRQPVKTARPRTSDYRETAIAVFSSDALHRRPTHRGVLLCCRRPWPSSRRRLPLRGAISVASPCCRRRRDSYGRHPRYPRRRRYIVAEGTSADARTRAASRASGLRVDRFGLGRGGRRRHHLDGAGTRARGRRAQGPWARLIACTPSPTCAACAVGRVFARHSPSSSAPFRC